MPNLGKDIYQLAKLLFPICRSITGNGVRESLKIIQQRIPALQIHEIPTGTTCFDWKIPQEWNIRDAYIVDPNGDKIVDFKVSNLHVVGYSIPINKTIDLDELQNHLYSLPEQEEAIPYITSYYKPRWGFCLSHKQRKTLKPGKYTVFIDSTLADGNLTYGELILPGKTKKEIFLSTYLCHPSLANDNLSGPCVTTFLAEWLSQLPSRQNTYRIIFIPETIGAIAYLSRNMQHMKKNIIAGFNLTCIGDDRGYSYLPSKDENTLADKIAIHVLKHEKINYVTSSYLDRGSDERQYCSPGINLPIVSIMRSRYDTYPEYHTSLDNLDLISPNGLYGGYEILRKCLACLEYNNYYKVNVFCEPQLSKRGLYPTTSTKESIKQVYDMMNLLAYCDGEKSLLDIADKMAVPMWSLFTLIDTLKKERLLEVSNDDVLLPTEA